MSDEHIIRNFILENYLFTDDQSELGNDDSFLEKGIIDSTGVLEIISFLEDKFDTHINDEEMLPENLDSVNNILQFMEGKRGLAG